jgi:hypothetical protein
MLTRHTISIAVVVAFCCHTSSICAQSPSPTPSFVTLQYPDSQLSDVLSLYAHLTGRKLWLELGLPMNVKVTIFHPKPMPQSEALSLIRGTLLQDCRIEIRESGDAEAYVARSVDPHLDNLRLHLSPIPSPSSQPRVHGPLQKQP